MSPKLILQEGAILIADAHYSDQNPYFFSFLKAVDEGRIKTPQLILMGDMFELLFGKIKQTQVENEKVINLLNKLSKKINVSYFEGNHDFLLKNIFPNIVIYPIKEQPQEVDFNKQKVMLSHGDTHLSLSYTLYTNIIRNGLTLSILSLVNTLCLNCIMKWLKKRGNNKDQCYKIASFEEMAFQRLLYLKEKALDIVIEGHFHQNTSFKLYGFEYINLASFACNQKYFIVQSSKGQFFLHETRFEESE